MIVIKRGDTLRLAFTYKDQANIPVDITGHSIKIQGKASGTMLFNCNIGTGVTVTNAQAGTFELYIQNTTSFLIGTYDIDIQYTDTSNDVKSSDNFNIQVIGDISI